VSSRDPIVRAGVACPADKIYAHAMVNIAKLPDTSNPAGYIAGEVRAELGRRGWSASRLAFELGLTQAAISRRLTGEVVFDVEELAKIGDLLNIHPGDFFPGGRRGPKDDALALSEVELRMILALRGASDAGRTTSVYDVCPVIPLFSGSDAVELETVEHEHLAPVTAIGA
jgi:transcriptional regulator with XRE-family HTH domain